MKSSQSSETKNIAAYELLGNLVGALSSMEGSGLCEEVRQIRVLKNLLQWHEIAGPHLAPVAERLKTLKKYYDEWPSYVDLMEEVERSQSKLKVLVWETDKELHSLKISIRAAVAKYD